MPHRNLRRRRRRLFCRSVTPNAYGTRVSPLGSQSILARRTFPMTRFMARGVVRVAVAADSVVEAKVSRKVHRTKHSAVVCDIHYGTATAAATLSGMLYNMHVCASNAEHHVHICTYVSYVTAERASSAAIVPANVYCHFTCTLLAIRVHDLRCAIFAICVAQETVGVLSAG